MESILKAKIDLLEMLINRECGCDKSRCAEHFFYMSSLLYEYKQKYEAIRISSNN